MTAARALQKMVHVGCRDLGIDGETRRDLQLMVTGKESMADMAEADLEKLVEALKAKGFKPGFKPGSKALKGRPAAPRADLRFVHVLWKLLAEAGAVKMPGRDGLNGFVRARFSKQWGSVPLDVDALREWKQINDVVAALKDWCKREGIKLK